MKDNVRRILTNENASATAVYYATLAELGPACLNWEPETIWLELDRAGVDIEEINRDKLMACFALKLNPAFYWNHHVFENTCMVFNSLVDDPGVFHEALPEHVAWAVFEARKVVDEEPEYYHDAGAYTAVVLHRDGFVVAPSLLDFAQPHLDLLNRNTDLKAVVTAAYNDKNYVVTGDEEDVIDVQVARLRAVDDYVAEHKETLLADLESLS